MLTLDLPITPEEEEAWRAMPVSALVNCRIEAGCLARILPPLNGKPGRNTGRVVRVLLPIKPGDTFGPAGKYLSMRVDATIRYWLVAPVDAKPLRGRTTKGTTYDTPALPVNEPALKRIEEGATNDNDNDD